MKTDNKRLTIEKVNLANGFASSDGEFDLRMNVVGSGGTGTVKSTHARLGRLIKAAPELLAAARAYLEVIQGDNSPEAEALRAAILRSEAR